MRTVYIETSVWAMMGMEQPALLRDFTKEFLDQCTARNYSSFISEVVGNELKRAPLEAQRLVFSQLDRVSPVTLPLLPEIDQLAQAFLKYGILTERRIDDARHVAYALIHRLDVLVSWNYRHIANVSKAASFNAIAVLEGYTSKLEIRTPMELIE